VAGGADGADGFDRAGTRITPTRAAFLGAVQGPAELLPVSSTAHLTLLPWLGDWNWDGMDPELRKSFEIALHAGTAAALLIGQRRVIVDELSSFDTRRAGVLGLSFVPPAALGFAFERQIERRLGGPLPTAIGLLAGAAMMTLADRRSQTRGRGTAGAVDGLALGIAQACAFFPGVSRNGATLAAARWRGFTREQSNMLSRTVALPVIVGAAALKGARLWRRGLPGPERRAFAAGTTTSFASSLASQALIRLVERDRALWPYAAYRAGLAGVVLGRLWRRRRRRRFQPPPPPSVNGSPRGGARGAAADTLIGARRAVDGDPALGRDASAERRARRE
jgi:undecaprenyl-diphosphatase